MDANRIDPGTLEREIEQNRTELDHTLDVLGERLSFRHLSAEIREHVLDWQSAARFVQDHPIPIGITVLLATAALVRRSRTRPTGWLYRPPQPTVQELLGALLARAAAATRRTQETALESASELQERAATMAGEALHRAADVTRHAGAHLREGGHEAHEQVVSLARREPVLFGALAMLVGATLCSALRPRSR